MLNWKWIGLALLFSLMAVAEEAIDLTQLGFDDFTPYVVERNFLWVLLPVLMIGIVLVHLKQVSHYYGDHESDEEDFDDTGHPPGHHRHNILPFSRPDQRR